MKRFKQPKTAVTLSKKDLNRMKKELSAEITEKAMLLILAAAINVVGMTEDQVIKTYQTASRYAGYLDDHLAGLIDLQKTIEKGTGLKLRGWSK